MAVTFASNTTSLSFTGPLVGAGRVVLLEDGGVE